MLEIVKSNESIRNEVNLDDVLRDGARQLLCAQLELEVQNYIEAHKNELDASGRRLVVRNGYSKERTITTGCGQIKVSAPRVNDKRGGGKFTSKILPPFLRKTPNMTNLIPALYLRGLSTNKIAEGLVEILGPEACRNMSSSTVSRLCSKWESDYEFFNKKLITENFIYVWVDGVYMNVRLGDDKKICLLVVMGVTESGEKRLLAVEFGYRESKESWKELFISLIKRGFKPPLVMIADGALGFWSAINELEAFKDVKAQRCWVHKIKNVLNKLPQSVQGLAKSQLHEMMHAPDEATAVRVKKKFAHQFKHKYEKAYKVLDKDWDKLTTFFHFPAEHWPSIRTTNPLESNFATVKLRTKSTRGSGSPRRAAVLAFKLLEECQKKWRKIRGHQKIQPVLMGLEFKDGLVVNKVNQNLDDTAT